MLTLIMIMIINIYDNNYHYYDLPLIMIIMFNNRVKHMSKEKRYDN